MKKCILFGAGADAPLGVGTGGDFARNVLGILPESSNIDKINEAIKKYYSRIEIKNDPWYPKYQCRSWKEEQLVKASLRRSFLESENEVKDEEFKSQFNTIICDYCKKVNLVDKYPSYMGMIENKFPTLIAPTILGQVKFWQVVSCYCRAYLYIVNEVLKKEDYESYLNPTKELIVEIRDASRKAGCAENYYTIIRDISPTIDISVVTTNYTLYCEEISGLDKEHISYVHGRIGLYESPKSLSVYDVEQESIDKEIVFPYFFIQSGVKPIVERKQIEEYSKMLRFMDNAEMIIVTGYHLNNDDNHINSIIRSAILNGKKVVYLAFDDGKMGLLRREEVLRKLRLSDTISNLEWHSMTSADAYSVFRSMLLL